MEENIKAEFRTKVGEATDERLISGYGYIKKQLRLAQVLQDKERQDVTNMLENPTYLKALDQAEQAKLRVSILTWKLHEIESEQQRRFIANTKESDMEFGKA